MNLMMNGKTKSLLTGLLCSGVMHAEVISFNFHKTSVNNQLVFGDYGVELAGNWTNSVGSDFSNLQDSSGNPTTADVAVVSGGGQAASFSGAPLNGTPMKSGLQFFGDATSSVELSEIPYANYKIIVYLTGYNDNDASMISDGASTIFWDPKAFSGILNETTQSTYKEGTVAIKANYAIFGSDEVPLTGPSATLSFSLAPGAQESSGGIGGFQIVEISEVEPPTGAPEISAVSYDASGTMLSLTWSSNSSETYAIKYSTDMVNWEGELDDGVDGAAGETTTQLFDLSETTELDGVDRVFFRVEKIQPAG